MRSGKLTKTKDRMNMFINKLKHQKHLYDVKQTRDELISLLAKLKKNHQNSHTIVRLMHAHKKLEQATSWEEIQSIAISIEDIRKQNEIIGAGRKIDLINKAWKKFEEKSLKKKEALDKIKVHLIEQTKNLFPESAEDKKLLQQLKCYINATTFKDAVIEMLVQEEMESPETIAALKKAPQKEKAEALKKLREEAEKRIKEEINDDIILDRVKNDFSKFKKNKTTKSIKGYHFLFENEIQNYKLKKKKTGADYSSHELLTILSPATSKFENKELKKMHHLIRAFNDTTPSSLSNKSLASLIRIIESYMSSIRTRLKDGKIDHKDTIEALQYFRTLLARLKFVKSGDIPENILYVKDKQREELIQQLYELVEEVNADKAKPKRAANESIGDSSAPSTRAKGAPKKQSVDTSKSFMKRYDKALNQSVQKKPAAAKPKAGTATTSVRQRAKDIEASQQTSRKPVNTSLERELDSLLHTGKASTLREKFEKNPPPLLPRKSGSGKD